MYPSPVACLQHGVDDVDYELDVLGDFAALDKDDAKDTLVHFVQLAEEFRDGDDFDLELDHADLINGASGLGVGETIDAVSPLGRRDPHHLHQSIPTPRNADELMGISFGVFRRAVRETVATARFVAIRADLCR